jgi:hypothetical protein
MPHVMAGLVRAIDAFLAAAHQDVDARHKPGMTDFESDSIRQNRIVIPTWLA